MGSTIKSTKAKINSAIDGMSICKDSNNNNNDDAEIVVFQEGELANYKHHYYQYMHQYGHLPLANYRHSLWVLRQNPNPVALLCLGL